MSKLLFETNCGNFTLEVPFTWIEGDSYVKRAECTNAINIAFAEIERLEQLVDDTKSRKDEQINKLRSEFSKLTGEFENIRKRAERCELPGEPIEVASFLINQTDTYRNVSGMECECNIYGKSELKQIAEHLMVYVNNLEDGN